MTIHNREIAELLGRLADLLEIEGANAFRVRAYRQAAQTIGGLSETLADRVRKGEDLSDLPNIGKSMADDVINTRGLGDLRRLLRRD